MIRYTYSTHAAREKAEFAIEDMFAAGEVSECERPEIYFRHGRYHVTLVDINLSSYLPR